MLRRLAPLAALVALALPACANDDDLVLADAAHDAAAAAAAKQLLAAHAADLHASARALCASAPPPGPSGWSNASAPAAVASMRASWKQAHLAYEGLEGATDLFFSDLDASLDTRYDDALTLGPDPDLFDAQGFVGLHAVERILWADSIPPAVTAFESTLPGYAPAAFPAGAFEASEFADALCARLVTDTAKLEARVAALSLDSPSAYEAAVHLIKGQLVKLQEAGAGKDESRYAGFTLADMGGNVAAAKATHAAFHGWLLTKHGGAEVDAAIASGFAGLDKAYAAYAAQEGDRLSPSAGWSSVDPGQTMIITPFGQLFLAVRHADDETSGGALLSSMGQAIQLLGIAPSTGADGGVEASSGLPPDTT